MYTAQMKLTTQLIVKESLIMENDLVKIYTAYDHIQAEMAVGALENQQIQIGRAHV